MRGNSGRVTRGIASTFIVCMHTQYYAGYSLTVQLPDETWVERDWPANTKIAREKGLVAGEARSQAAIARLERQPGFARQFGIAAAQSSRL